MGNTDEDQTVPGRSTLSSFALVANIINDPSSVQEEVENTLKSLHERYIQLQHLIESRSKQEQCYSPEGKDVIPPEVPSNKPIRGPASVAALEFEQQKLDSTPSATISTEELSPTRTFGSEELIALHVLRTSLKNPLNTSQYSYSTKTGSSGDDSISKLCEI